MSTLQHRYSRLLRWYPADHRRVHEDEMLGVLLASARPGQERPTARDRADLIGGALRIRFRRALSSAADGWGDALAVTGVLAALLLAAQQLAYLAVGVRMWGSPQVWDYAFTVAAVAIAVCAVVGARRSAVLMASVYVAGAAAIAVRELQMVELPIPNMVVSHLLLVVLMAGLLAGPGPRRGVAIVGRRRAVVLGGVFTASLCLNEPLSYGWNWLWGFEALTIFAVLGGLAVTRPLGRRAALMLALPAATGIHAIQPVVPYSDGGYVGLLSEPAMTVVLFTGEPSVITFVPVLAFAVTALGSAVRRRRNAPEEPPHQPPVAA
ncbi:MAG TPA: hypothetical protein VHJ17_01640 [Thermomonospora sp.]|nr:hypothetical protein [Thermomonospora sp.]